MGKRAGSTRRDVKLTIMMSFDDVLEAKNRLGKVEMLGSEKHCQHSRRAVEFDDTTTAPTFLTSHARFYLKCLLSADVLRSK